MEIGNQLSNQLGVALLAVLGSLFIRRFQIPRRILPLAPMVLSILIVWIFLEVESVGEVLRAGTVSGLLAGGILYLLLGITSK